MKRILIVGYGIITSGIVKNLDSQFFDIYIYSKHLKKMNNVTLITELEELNELLSIDIVITCFSNDEESYLFFNRISTFLNNHYQLSFVNLTTSKPTHITYLKEKIEKSENIFIESPFTGSKSGSDSGELSLFIHREHPLKSEVSKLFSDISKKQYFFKESTEPTKFKLIYNTWGAFLLNSIKIFNPKEFNFSEDSLKIANEIIKNDGWMANVCNSKLDQINQKTFDEISFKLEYMIKDIQYAQEEVFKFKFKEINELHTSITPENNRYLDYDFSIIGDKYE